MRKEVARKLCVGAVMAALVVLPGDEGSHRWWKVGADGKSRRYTREFSRPVGLVVIGSHHDLEGARRLARKARDALGLRFDDFEYLPGFGFTLPEGGCVEEGYPCTDGARGRENPGAYVNMEMAGGYDQLAAEKFIVIAANGPPGCDLLVKTLAKAQAAFPHAYEARTRLRWVLVED
jgi:hypothetical protein